MKYPERSRSLSNAFGISLSAERTPPSLHRVGDEMGMSCVAPLTTMSVVWAEAVKIGSKQSEKVINNLVLIMMVIVDIRVGRAQQWS